MPDDRHRLERLVDIAASRVAGRIDAMATTLRPRNGRPAFTTQTSQREALALWRKNWDDPKWQQALLKMDPMAQMELSRLVQGAEEAPAPGDGLQVDDARPMEE